MFQLLLLLAMHFTISSVGFSQTTNYPSFCQDAATNDSLFAEFRRHEMCTSIVETVGYDMGLDLLTEIKIKYPYLMPHFNKICREDTVGKPCNSYYFSDINGSCSATVIRYVKVAGDLIKFFGDLSQFNIVEIGGGYGGQCKILHDISGFKNYTIIDLPECCPLIDKYLSHFNINNFQTLKSTSINQQQEFDLVISNYAFSEIDRIEQGNYIEKIIKKSKRGYMIYNNFANMNPFSIAQFEEILLKNNKIVHFFYDDPSKGGSIIVWYS